MQNLVNAALRGKAGVAAAVLTAGGLAGAVLLAPGTAFADTGPSVNTATSITNTQEWNYSWNVSTIRIDVSVTAQSGSSAPAGDVVVSTGPARDQSCAATLDQSSGLTSTGYCYLKYLADGWYKLTASYGGQAAFGSSVSVENPFAVSVSAREPHVSTQLNCPRYLVSGRSGWCTLVVSDSGPARASGVTARVYLPSQLRVRSCGPWCWVSGSAVSWRLGTVNPWQTRSVTVYVTARFSAPHWWQRSVRVSVGGAAYWNHSWWQNGASHTSTQVTILRRR